MEALPFDLARSRTVVEFKNKGKPSNPVAQADSEAVMAFGGSRLRGATVPCTGRTLSSISIRPYRPHMTTED